MFILKNINKNIFFFALFAFFVFFPFQTVLAICNPANPCSPPDLPVCGDGYKESSEACDDGPENPGNLDGCYNTGANKCTITSGWYCRGGTGDTSVCYRNCGNGVISTVPPEEVCDWGEVGRPGTTITSGGNGTVCTATYNGTCTYCTNSCTNGTITGPRCGDNIINGPESCDDGNSTDGDGCNSTCSTEVGWNCPADDSSCVPICGDAKILGAETCDQGYGNITPNDGCSSTCQQENGWNCFENPCAGLSLVQYTACVRSYGLVCDLGDTDCIANLGHSICRTICGDGLKLGSEACDDGNRTDDDGCNRTCTIKSAGYTCTPGSACTTECGDGIQAGSETCEDNPGNSITEKCSYGVTECQVCDMYCRRGDGITSFCGNNIVDNSNGEECDYDSQPADRLLAVPHDGDGCSTTCKEEEGWDCFISPATGKNTCVFHCGNQYDEPDNAFFREGCDYGTVGSANPTTGQPVTGIPRNGAFVFNGDACTSAGYNGSCDWCTLDCQLQTSRGEYCGDGMKNGPEACDDGNLNAFDGCFNCAIETGWICTGFYSTCNTKCGDRICVTNATNPTKREGCVSCNKDCGACAIGQKPGIAIAHPENLFNNFFEKLKATFVRPTLLINIPGLELNKPPKEAFVLPPPNETKYDPGVPTNILVGDQNYTITVSAPNTTTGAVTFSIR